MKFFQRCPHCNEQAFEYKQKPQVGMVLNADSVEHIDHLKPGDKITCQKCKKAIGAKFLSNEYLITQV